MAVNIFNTRTPLGTINDGKTDKYESGYTNMLAYWQGKRYATGGSGLNLKDPKVIGKIANLKSTIPYYLVEQVDESIKSMLPTGYNFNLRGSVTLSPDKRTFCLNTVVEGFENGAGYNFTVPLNLSVEMLLEMGPIELQSVVTSMVYASIMNSSSLEGGSLEKLREGEKTDSGKSNEVNEAESTISDYVVAYLKKLNPFKSNGYIGDSESFDYAPVGKIVSSSIIAKVKEFAGDGCSLETAAKMAVDGMFDEKTLQEAKTLKAQGMQADYEDKLIHSHESRKEQLARIVSESGSDRQAFCVSFIEGYLSSFNIDSSNLAISFDNTGVALGMFYPGSDKSMPRININLDKVKDTTDLCMTLTHELSHYMDQVSGVKARTCTYGSKSEIKACELAEDSAELALMTKLQNICYHLDPEEQSAREAEILGLETMEEVAKSDSSYEQEVAANKLRHETYKARTRMMEDGLLSGKGEFSLDSLANEIASCNVSEEVREIMLKKLRYLQQRKLEIENEKKRKAEKSESASEIGWQPGE